MAEMGFFGGGEETHHWTTVPQMVVITGAGIEEVNFEFGNGYTISGRLTLPEAQTSTQDWETWWWVGHMELETPQRAFLAMANPYSRETLITVQPMILASITWPMEII
jgi:hypothetical protein